MSRRRCDFCGEKAHYVYSPRDGIDGCAMCYWHVLLFYLGIDMDWQA